MLSVDQAGSNASFFGSLALLPGNETVLVEQNDWSEERNINPYAVFDKPPAMLQITPNLGRRGQTGINFTPSKSGIVLRCDGQVMASNLISDEAGRVSASFTIPTNARNGNRIVEMADASIRPGPVCRSTIRWSSPASSASSRTASSRARGTGGLAHPDHLRAPRPAGPDLPASPRTR